MSAHLGSNKCPPGRTWFGASLTVVTDNSAEGLLGQEIEVKNKAALSSVTRRNQKSRWMRFVKNNSGCILYPGQAVVYGTSRIGEYIAGVQGASAAEQIAGVVDDWLPASGVRVGDYFWIVVEGEVLALTPMAGSEFVATSIVAGDLLRTGITGAASTGATSGAPLTGFTGGRVLPVLDYSVTAQTNGTLWASERGRFARALSSKTSGQTNSQILIDIIRRLK